MDGYAVRAKDTFGAGESSPGLFMLAGEVAMGRPAQAKVGPGRTVRVWTGGMLPDGADAVVMLEYARVVDQAEVELTKAVAPGGNTIAVGEDVARGETVLPAGRRLRPQELGLLAALGQTRVKVVRRPRAAVISTGIELVPAEARPGPAQVRDINTHTLTAQIREAGAEPSFLGTVPDDPDRLKELVARGLEEADTVLVSGGSSVGAADWTLATFLSFPGAELLIHGVSISPGKPLILVRVGQKSLWGLPGHAASAMITFHLFLKPLLTGRLLGAELPDLRIKARLSRNLALHQGPGGLGQGGTGPGGPGLPGRSGPGPLGAHLHPGQGRRIGPDRLQGRGAGGRGRGGGSSAVRLRQKPSWLLPPRVPKSVVFGMLTNRRALKCSRFGGPSLARFEGVWQHSGHNSPARAKRPDRFGGLP